MGFLGDKGAANVYPMIVTDLHPLSSCRVSHRGPPIISTRVGGTLRSMEQSNPAYPSLQKHTETEKRGKSRNHEVGQYKY